VRAPLTRGQGQVGAERPPKVAPGRVGGGWGGGGSLTCSGLHKLGSGARWHGLGSPWIRRASVASQYQVPLALLGKGVSQRLYNVNRGLAFVKAAGHQDKADLTLNKP
jgi:hypothetical protein